MNNGGGYSPFMFGQNCYPNGNGMNNQQGFNQNVYAGQSSRRDAYNVRDCMYWPASLSTDSSRQANPRFNGPITQASFGMPQTCTYPSFNRGDQYNYNQAGNMTSSMTSPANFNSDYTFHTGVTGDYSTGEPQQQQQQQQQQAPAKAFIQSDGKGHIPIPCNVSQQPGVVPPCPTMPAMGYKVTVPQSPPSEPIQFEVSSQAK